MAGTDDRNNILASAALVMVCLAVVVTATGTVVLYRTSLHQKRAELQTLALCQAHLIEATFRNNTYGHSPSEHVASSDISSCPQCLEKIVFVGELLQGSQSQQREWGSCVEFVVAKRDGDTIRIMLLSGEGEPKGPAELQVLPWESELVEPMRLALSSQSGAIKAKDYRGEQVLAAYAPIPLLGWGVVAKIDMSEMRAPFVAAARDGLPFAILGILVGLAVLRRQLKPLIEHLQDSEDHAIAALAELSSQKYAMDEHAIVAVTNTTGEIIYANDKFCQISQYSREELIGRDHRIVNSGHHPRAFWADAWKTIAAGKVWSGEVCNRAKDGSLYWLDTTNVPFKGESGRVTQYVSIRTDVTEHKRLSQERERFSRVIEESLHEIFMFDAESLHFIDVNYGARKNTGYTMAEFRELTPSCIKPDFSHEEFVRLIQPLRDGTREALRFETVHQRKDGSQYPVDIQLQLMKSDSAVFVAMTLDITERRQSENDLRASLAAAESAESADRAKSEFLANMSHEIRTPMTAILGFTESLLDSDQSEEERIDCISTIRRNGEHLLGLINDILDLSKIEAQKMRIERKECQPCHIVAEVASLMRVRADAKGLPLNIEYVGAIPETIQSDPTRLRQILINLIGNAIKFTEVGSVRLVTTLVNNDGTRHLQFDIIDTGRGLTSEQSSNLFQPFMQADASTTREYGGTGLGLTISKRFAELLGGYIEVVATECGVGSTFRATVATGPLENVTMLDAPLEATIVAREPADVANFTPAVLRGSRILLAEDGPDNQRLFSFILKRAGSDLTIADNGQRAIEAVEAALDQGRPFDCIIMDMQMPIMDGYEATRVLRQRGYTGPIVALTAHAMASDREKCLKAGCDGYATKPIDRAKLVETVAHHIHSDSAAA